MDKYADPDEAFYQRCLEAGGKVWRGKDGHVVAAWVQPAKLSADDRARWAMMQKKSEALSKSQGVVCVDAPNPAGLLRGSRYWFMPTYPPEKYAEAMRQSRYTGAKARVDLLKRHEQLRDEVARLSAALPIEEGMVSNDPFWHDLAHAEMLALAYDAATPILRDRKRQQGARRGGKAGGQTKSADAELWRSKVVHEARNLLEGGKSPRDLASILATRFNKSARIIREVLKKAEVK